MTEKKELILDSALKLFAELGYASTSTAKIAKAAGVSEGLIFRHFINKKGLLKALLDNGKEQIEQMYHRAAAMENPKDTLAAILSFMFLIPKDQHPYWKLVYSLRWQSNINDDFISKSVRDLLIRAFQQLGYQNPEAETDAVLLIIDGIASAVLLRKPAQSVSILLHKYDL
jgi:AcrR family transcriptional regulator